MHSLFVSDIIYYVKTCRDCEIEKKLEEFDYRKDRSSYSNTCKPCRRQKMKQHYNNNKQYYIDKAKVNGDKVYKECRDYIIGYLRNNPCVDCGQQDIEVLEFDHRDRSTKLGSVGDFCKISLNKVKEEITKCDIRCANCHVKKTRRQLGWWTDNARVYPLATNELKG